MKFKSNIEIQAGVEASGSTGSNGQVLSSTGSGVAWINQIDVVSSADSAESIHISVKNTSGAQILKGTPVYVTGETGNSGKIEVAPADASDSAKMPALGLLESTLDNNAEGFCVQGGLLEGLATATIDGTATTANDTVYVKPGGGLTMTKPTGTGLIQNIAKVARAHASNGTLVVSSILRTNDVPNLTTGKIWVGDGNTVESTVVHLDEVNGRMGIGTASPSYQLTLGGNAVGSTEGLRINDPSNVAYGAHFSFSDTPNEIWIGGITNNVYNSAIGIHRESTRAVTIDINNNVGIGTDSPDYKLDVEGSANDADIAIRINNTFDDNLATSNPTSVLLLNAASNNGHLRVYGAPANTEAKHRIDLGSTAASSFLTFSPNNAERMRITSDGNVGIGTTSPGAKLHVNQSGTSGVQTIVAALSSTSLRPVLQFSEGTNATITAGMSIEYNGVGSGANNYMAINSVTGSPQFVVMSGGNVGIGTTDPSEKLNVSGNILATGTILGSNLSGTNTGDQDLSGYLLNTTVATDTALGLIKLFNNTDQTVAANEVTTTANRTYGLQLNSSNQAVINVPWTDTNTWRANAVDSDGYVAQGSGQANKVWKTDATGNPAWRTDANTTYTAGTGINLDSGAFRLQGGEIPGSVDLNTYRTTGIFCQNANSDAVSGSNYPVAQAGILEVYNDDYGNGLFTVQRYSKYNSINVYQRQYYNGTWTAWRDLTQDTNTTYTAGGGLTLTGTEFSHTDTSSQASVDNANGVVIQDVTLDTYGHVTGLASVNLDGRYYTETESDSRFVNVTGDTMTGSLIVDTPEDYDSTVVTSLTSAPINVPEVNIGTTAAFLPFLHQKARYASGYRTHMNLGLYKNANAWGDGETGFYIALGGNDSYPTEYFRMTFGGAITHSNGSLFWNSSNDGAGSGLDADFLDGQHASAFAPVSHTHTWASIPNNSVNGWGGLRHQTNSGYIDFGPANSSHAHIYTGSPNFYLNKSLTVNGQSIINTGDIRSAIFYDVNDTAYYLDPNSISVLAGFNLNSAGTAQFRYLAPGVGTVNINAPFAHNASFGAINIAMTDNDTGGIVIDNEGVTVYGAADTGTVFRVIDEDVWQTNGNNVSAATTFSVNQGNNGGALTRGTHTATNDFRAPIFYDSNDTGYYVNPAGNSQLSEVYYNGWLRNNSSGASGLYWEGNSSGSGWHIYPQNQQDMIFRTGSSNGGFKCTIANETARGYVHWTTSNEIGFLNSSRSWSLKVDNSGNSFATSSSRAPIFYDSNNTAYYLDPASTSQVGHLKCISTLSFGAFTAGTKGTLFEGYTTHSTVRTDAARLDFYMGKTTTGVGNVMSITDTGRVGIGTTNPSYTLDVAGTGNFQSNLRISNADQATTRLLINNTSSFGNRTFALMGGVHNSTQDGFSIYDTVAAATRFVILNTGNVGIGTTSPASYKLDVSGTGRFTSTVTATNFILSSDKTLKDNISDINTNHINVKWKNFELKSEPGVKRAGVVAQELEEKHPEFVRTDEDGIKSVAYIDLLIAKIAELEARLEKLEK